MTQTIDLTPHDLAILQPILAALLPAGTAVFVFGSRATGTARRYSDLDLALSGTTQLNPEAIARLQDALSDSDLTIKVDLVDLTTLDPAFRRIVEAEMITLSHENGPR
ncbi:nucleotidyltransferase family protein [Rhodopila sp.]|uniref:nucleotidyltransferase family protein n=1 Tax=Rhodopila sp. TaxID=2480087 RepID=UPI003D14C6DE